MHVLYLLEGTNLCVSQCQDKLEKQSFRFTDEEGYGRFLDLHVLYDAYINLKGIKASLLFILGFL